MDVNWNWRMEPEVISLSPVHLTACIPPDRDNSLLAFLCPLPNPIWHGPALHPITQEPQAESEAYSTLPGHSSTQSLSPWDGLYGSAVQATCGRDAPQVVAWSPTKRRKKSQQYKTSNTRFSGWNNEPWVAAALGTLILQCRGCCSAQLLSWVWSGKNLCWNQAKWLSWLGSSRC